MKPLYYVIAAGLSLASTLTVAQQLYKCGNTYSQTPCAADAQPKKVFSGGGATQGADNATAGKKGLDLCAAHAIKTQAFHEPATARTAPIGARKAEVIQYAGQPMVMQRFDLSLDSKTQYGVFSGPIAYSCWLSEDQARVLQFDRKKD